jgi:hypothetical protein
MCELSTPFNRRHEDKTSERNQPSAVSAGNCSPWWGVQPAPPCGTIRVVFSITLSKIVLMIEEPEPHGHRRGRPPKPGGRISQADVQRAYRARLKARLDANCDVEELREALRRTLVRLELREEDVARLRQRNERLEAELATESRHHSVALKEIVVLKQRLA